MKQAYIDKRFTAESLDLIRKLAAIVAEYVAAEYRLTVRQLYYQLVARDIVENTEKSYKRITGLVNDAKLAGLLDWEAIEDRTREFIRRSHWDSAADIVRASRDSFHMDMWTTQPNRVFVIVEKEALAGVLERCSRKLDVPLLAARGYPSGTVLREFCVGMLANAMNNNQEVKILHLGDHDPSGIDMTRDLEERINLFTDEFGGTVEMRRIALNMDQIKSQKPPPNPAKTNDPRFQDYLRVHGPRSWELDALKPEFLDRLVTNNVTDWIDTEKWEEREAEIEDKRSHIAKMCETFEKKGI